MRFFFTDSLFVNYLLDCRLFIRPVIFIFLVPWMSRCYYYSSFIELVILEVMTCTESTRVNQLYWYILSESLYLTWAVRGRISRSPWRRASLPAWASWPPPPQPPPSPWAPSRRGWRSWGRRRGRREGRGRRTTRMRLSRHTRRERIWNEIRIRMCWQWSKW